MRRALVAVVALTLGSGLLALVFLRRIWRVLTRSGEQHRAPEPAAPGTTGGRLALVLIPAGGLAGGVFLVAIAVPRLLAEQHFPMSPGQPIQFSHQVHVEQAGLDCAFCHRTANNGVTAGLPDVQQCMFCHVVVQGNVAGRAEIERLQELWSNGQTIDWARVHRLPDHSRFPHDAHLQAGVPCATCHGAVEQMGLANQVRSLNMADCVGCHQETSAPTDCVACHY